MTSLPYLYNMQVIVVDDVVEGISRNIYNLESDFYLLLNVIWVELL